MALPAPTAQMATVLSSNNPISGSGGINIAPSSSLTANVASGGALAAASAGAGGAAQPSQPSPAAAQGISLIPKRILTSCQMQTDLTTTVTTYSNQFRSNSHDSQPL